MEESDPGRRVGRSLQVIHRLDAVHSFLDGIWQARTVERQVEEQTVSVSFLVFQNMVDKEVIENQNVMAGVGEATITIECYTTTYLQPYRTLPRSSHLSKKLQANLPQVEARSAGGPSWLAY